MEYKTFLKPDEVIMEAALPDDSILFLTKKGELPQTRDEFVMKIQNLLRRIVMFLSLEMKDYAEMVLNDAMEEQSGWEKIDLDNKVEAYLQIVDPEIMEAGVFGGIVQGYAETILAWNKDTPMEIVRTADDPDLQDPQEAADSMVEHLFGMTYDRGKYE